MIISLLHGIHFSDEFFQQRRSAIVEQQVLPLLPPPSLPRLWQLYRTN